LTVGNGGDLLHRSARAAATALLCAYARRILGAENSDFFDLPDNHLNQRILAAATTAIRGSEALRRVLPGATRLSEACGHRIWVAAAQRMMQQHHGDPRYGRHDRLAVTALKPPTDATPQRSNVESCSSASDFDASLEFEGPARSPTVLTTAALLESS
jgi:hypothetical protein